jgi:hypothetical protein
METYCDRVIFYVYRKSADTYHLVGKLIYDSSKLALLKRQYWRAVKVNALDLGESFNDSDEFLKRILAVKQGTELT